MGSVRLQGSALWFRGTFFPAPGIRIDEDSNVRLDFPKELQKRMDELLDGFSYLDPQDLRQRKKTRRHCLVVNYGMELQRRESPPGFRGMGNKLKEVDKQILSDSDNPLLVELQPVDSRALVQNCLEQKRRNSAPPSVRQF